MSPSPQTEVCVECGESLALFQPTCPECGTDHSWSYRAPCHDCGKLARYTGEECPHCGAKLSVWRALEADVLDSDEPITVWKDAVARPIDAGYRLHLGSVHGQWADYRRSLGEDGDLHVRSYPKRYELHHDDVSAIDRPGYHLLRHGPTVATATGIEVATRAGRTVAESGQLLRRIARSPYRWLESDSPDERHE